MKIVVPYRHESAQLFRASGNGKDDLQRFARALLSLLEAVYERRLPPDRIPLEALRRAMQRLGE